MDMDLDTAEPIEIGNTEPDKRGWGFSPGLKHTQNLSGMANKTEWETIPDTANK